MKITYEVCSDPAECTRPDLVDNIPSRRPKQRYVLHQPKQIGYLFANANYSSVIRDNSMLSDLPPWFMVLGPGTITALRTIRALLRIKIPMETDFATIYRLLRTVCGTITYDEVLDAMVTFFGPPKQCFEEFLLGFAIRNKTSVATHRFTKRECIFYSAIAFFSIEIFEFLLDTPIPRLTVNEIPPHVFWILNQSVVDSTKILEGFVRLLLAYKSPYIRPLPNSLISIKNLDQTARMFDWCDCKNRAIKNDYLHTKHAHKDSIWLTKQPECLPEPDFIDTKRAYKRLVQQTKDKKYVPFIKAKPSLFKLFGYVIDPTNTKIYSPMYRKAKRIYEYRLNRKFEHSAKFYWHQYYQGRIPRNREGRLFEVFKAYHRTQYCPKKLQPTRDAYRHTEFLHMKDCFEYGEVFDHPAITQLFHSHPHSEPGTTLHYLDCDNTPDPSDTVEDSEDYNQRAQSEQTEKQSAEGNADKEGIINEEYLRDIMKKLEDFKNECKTDDPNNILDLDYIRTLVDSLREIRDGSAEEKVKSIIDEEVLKGILDSVSEVERSRSRASDKSKEDKNESSSRGGTPRGSISNNKIQDNATKNDETNGDHNSV